VIIVIHLKKSSGLGDISSPYISENVLNFPAEAVSLQSGERTRLNHIAGVQFAPEISSREQSVIKYICLPRHSESGRRPGEQENPKCLMLSDHQCPRPSRIFMAETALLPHRYLCLSSCNAFDGPKNDPAHRPVCLLEAGSRERVQRVSCCCVARRLDANQRLEYL